MKFWKEIEKVDGSRIKVKARIYGLRRCNNNECRITWDRDNNASKNIRLILEHELKALERPKYLCHKKTAEKTPKQDASLGLTHPSS